MRRGFGCPGDWVVGAGEVGGWVVREILEGGVDIWFPAGFVGGVE